MFDIKLRIGVDHIFWLLVGYLIGRMFTKEGSTPSEAAALDAMTSGEEFEALMEEEEELENEYQEYQHAARISNLADYQPVQGAS